MLRNHDDENDENDARIDDANRLVGCRGSSTFAIINAIPTDDSDGYALATMKMV